VGAVLSIETATKRWVGRDRSFELAIEDVTLGPGDVVALVGPSGSGKSTFLEILGLAVAPDSARGFLLDDAGAVSDLGLSWRRRAKEELARLRRRHFGYVLQDGSLLPFLTVRANAAGLAAGDPAVRERAELLLQALGIGALAGERPDRLSVGQRQRVAVARALATRPDFLLADEPTAALDPASARLVLDLLLRLAAEDGIAICIVSHDQALVAALALPTFALTSTPEEGVWRTTIRGPEA
jgi:putative ABC transport system ATP-binding protein